MRSKGLQGNHWQTKASMTSSSANIDFAALALGDVVVTGKGAKQIPLSAIGGEPVIWKPKDALNVLFEPSAYNQPDATRVNLCLSVTPTVASALQELDEWFLERGPLDPT